MTTARIRLTGLRRASPAPGPAQQGLDRLGTRLVTWVRASTAVVGSLVAVVGLAPPARPGPVLASVAGLLVWSGLSTRLLSRQGPTVPIATIDTLVVVLLCLYRDRLLPAGALQASAGTGWVDIIAGAGVFTAQWGLRQPFGVAAGLVIAGAAAVGAGGGSWESPTVLVVQTVLAAAITGLLRRGAVATDVAQVAEAAVRRTAAARAAARADERDHQRHLHDTVLATLTMVNTGSIGPDSSTLRRRAADDLAIIAALGRDPTRPPTGTMAPGTERLDLRLRSAVGTAGPVSPSIDVSLVLSPVEVPREVAVGITMSVVEALTNVARHAGTRSARLHAGPVGAGVRVVVEDDGAGFDPAAVAAHRRGIRESIHGRMRSVGGNANTVSSPGTGARIELWWPDG